MATQLIIGAGLVATMLYAKTKNKILEEEYISQNKVEEMNDVPEQRFPYIPIHLVLQDPNNQQYQYSVLDSLEHRTYLMQNGGIAISGLATESFPLQ